MMSNNNNLHEGHRQRMLSRVNKNGFTGLYPHEALEVFLFFSIPRRNTNPIAHALLERFGSLRNILFSARKNELTKVDGIGETSAEMLLSAVPCVSELIKKQFRETDEPLTVHNLAFLADWFMRDETRPIGVMFTSLDGKFYDFRNLPVLRRDDGIIDIAAMLGDSDDLPEGSCSLFIRDRELFSEEDIYEIRRVLFGMSLVPEEIYYLRGREPVPMNL